MYQPLDGPATHGAKSVTTSAQELKVGASVLEERKVVSMQPVDGDIYYGYSSGVTSSTGTKIAKGQFFSLECSSTLPIWMVASSGTVDVRITEVA